MLCHLCRACSTQKGLRGVQLGQFLLKRVVKQLQAGQYSNGLRYLPRSACVPTVTKQTTLCCAWQCLVLLCINIAHKSVYALMPWPLTAVACTALCCMLHMYLAYTELPHISTFATLSPIPGLVRWIDNRVQHSTALQQYYNTINSSSGGSSKFATAAPLLLPQEAQVY
jgi:Malonyl-CoA decarboxylase C-terminal domain